MKLARLALLSQKWSIYLVIGSQDCGNSVENMFRILTEALQAGVGCVQWREKGAGSISDAIQREQIAIRMKKLCHTYDTIFLINDDVSLACKVQADGVHVGHEDMPFAQVKQLVPPEMIIGISAGNIEEARIALTYGADYLGVGPMYTSKSKTDAGEPIGPKGLSAIRKFVGGYPIVAIGGIKPEHVSCLRKNGADAIAVISAITQAPDTKKAVQDFIYHVHKNHNYT
ncbi:thiamine-phosphate diphosphorylase [Brevibacillus laterosporus]|uniref:thiamine phosphate synthase n=1 Tax=Brevibacillus laterosporus TaxID=1465 RepID=UPI000BDCF2C7|nr:thiamine phosphate synthase [Brevibacillus laterosporus]PCN44676.1 thiamine-phosphate diphosphorylase [Brevibacillus laterosporus]